MRCVMSLLLAAATAAVVAGQLQGSISASTLAAAGEAATAALQHDLTPETALGAATVFKRLGKQASKAQCSTVAKLAGTASTPAAASRVAMSLKLLGCSSQLSAESAALAPAVAQGLSSPSLGTLALAVQAAPLVGADLDASSAATSVLAHVVQGAVFGADAGAVADGVADGQSTAAGLTALASLYSKISSDTALSKRVKSVLKGLGAAIGSAEVGVHAPSLAAATHASLRLAKAVKGGSPRLPSSTLATAANALLVHASSADVTVLGPVLSAAKLLGKDAGPIAQLPSVSLSAASVRHGHPQAVEVYVTDVWGEPLPADVTLVKAAPAKPVKGAAVANDVSLTGADTLGKAAASWAPGVYTLTIRVNPGDGATFEAITTHRQLAVTADFSWGEAIVLVSASPDGTSGVLGQQRASLAHPAAAKKAFTAGPGQHLQVLVSGAAAGGSPLLAREATLLLTHTESGAVAAFKASAAAEAQEAGLKFSVDAGSRTALQAAAAPGTYTLTLIAGAPGVTGAAWALGTVKLSPPEAVPGPAPPLYTTPLLHESDIATAALPEIAHQFRPPAPRPPVFVSFLFAGATVAPLAVLVLYFLGTAPSVTWRKQVPMLSGLVFLASLGGILGVFAMYWLDAFNMFVCLAYTGVLCCPLTLAGSSFLRGLRKADKAAA